MQLHELHFLGVTLVPQEICWAEKFAWDVLSNKSGVDVLFDVRTWMESFVITW
jgi:hypothetical protein